MQLLSFCVLGLGDLNIIKGSVTKCINLACTRARYLFARNWKKKISAGSQLKNGGHRFGSRKPWHRSLPGYG